MPPRPPESHQGRRYPASRAGPPRGPDGPQQLHARAGGRRVPRRQQERGWSAWRARDALRGRRSRREAASQAPTMHACGRRSRGREIIAIRSGARPPRRLWAGWGWLGGEPKPCSGRAECRCRALRAVGVATCALVHVVMWHTRTIEIVRDICLVLSRPIAVIVCSFFILICVKCKPVRHLVRGGPAADRAKCTGYGRYAF